MQGDENYFFVYFFSQFFQTKDACVLTPSGVPRGRLR